MCDLELSVIHALDGEDRELYPFLSYLLQDLQEIGASPDVILSLIQKNIRDFPDHVSVLDLGCGKGAVSVHLAKHLGWHVTGIDGMDAFVQDARRMAEEQNVKSLCAFKTGDIRQMVPVSEKVHLVILGSIGPVLGDVRTTLEKVSGCLFPSGYVILDDGYTDDDTLISTGDYQSRESIESAIRQSGFYILDSYRFTFEEMKRSDDTIFQNIQKRAEELMAAHPRKKNVLLNYLQKQKQENQILENRMTCVTWLLQKTADGLGKI